LHVFWFWLQQKLSLEISLRVGVFQQKKNLREKKGTISTTLTAPKTYFQKRLAILMAMEK